MIIKNRISERYREALRWLCRRELRKIADKWPKQTRHELIQYYDLMAMCLAASNLTPEKDRLLGVALATSSMLEHSE